MIDWYVLRAKPNKEDFLWAELISRDIETFYPLIPVRTVNPRARKVRSYFPGYLFVHIDLEQNMTFDFRWLPGSTGLVSFDSKPANVPDNLIQAIRKQVDRINAVGGEGLDGLKHGDDVVITDGPFKGYEAIFDSRGSGNERVWVLLKMLRARLIPVELPVELFERKKQR
jgi:transcription antitermination factor NusG